MQIIANAVDQLKIGTPQNHLNLAMFPLVGNGRTAPEYVLLDDALEKKLARVMEVSEGGSVPELRFENSGDQSVLLVDGEELVGARQNRILNLTILVGAHTTVLIPVSCVERGRWHYRSRDFRSDRRTLFAKARALKMSQVSDSLRQSGSRHSDQHVVWNGITDKFARLHSASRTESMADLYDQQQGRLADFRRSFDAVPLQVGAVFAINGKPAGVELFDNAATFRRFLQKLLDSYAIDAIEDGESNANRVPSMPEVGAFLRRLKSASAEAFMAIGEGQDVRLRGQRISGGALVKDGQIIHLAAFAEAGL